MRMDRRGEQGSMLIELVVALGILTTALIPLAFSYRQEQEQCRSLYQRAVAMEIVDGEVEILAAGHWRTFAEGAQPYTVHAESATNLPPGKFLLTVRDPRLRLEWIPEQPGRISPVVREATGR